MKKAQIAKLYRKISNCKKCPLWKTRKNVVPGEGPNTAKIIIIGQAPGAEEDKTGRPFVGRAGKLLDKLFKIANLKKEKVFITSPIKCFPPKNRKPQKKEIQTCFPYLKEQIKIINPQRFILLGEIAFSVFFKNKKLRDYRGELIKKDNKKYFITYHPAAGIRFAKFKKVLEKDFRRIKKL